MVTPTVFNNFTNISLPIKILDISSLDVSFSLALVGAFFYYFGRLAVNRTIEEPKPVTCYLYGFHFSILYIFFGVVIAYYTNSEYISTIQPAIWILIQLVVMFILLKIAFKEEKGWHSSTYGAYIYKFIMSFKDGTFLIFLPFFSFLSTFRIYEKLNDYGTLILFVVSLLVTFYIISMLAMIYGDQHMKNSHGKIYLVGSGIIEGEMIKYGDPVVIGRGDTTIYIAKERIDYIELDDKL